MNIGELLPDKWEEVSLHWQKKHYHESLRNLRSKKTVFESCMGCPAFRVKTISVYGLEYVLISCVFFDKCIKQYPLKVDNEEFK